MFIEFLRMKAVRGIVLAMMFLAVGISASAKDDGGKDLTLEIKAQKEVKVQKDGKWTVKYVPVEKTLKGDVLLYTISYINKHDFEIMTASIVDPIPEGTEYMLGSAAGENTDISFSINGGDEYQAPPAMYMVLDSDGNGKRVPAPASMHTHIKWLIKGSVPPGGSGEVSLKIKVK